MKTICFEQQCFAEKNENLWTSFEHLCQSFDASVNSLNLLQIKATIFPNSQPSGCLF